MPQPTLTRMLASVGGFLLLGCGGRSVTDPPPEGWANSAPTTVEVAVTRGEHQLLKVRQGSLSTWVEVPDVQAKVGDFVLLGKGNARKDVPIPELSLRAPQVVDITHVKVVDEATARQASARPAPAGAVAIGAAYAELDQRADTEVLVFGRVVKAPSAVGSVWVHLQDGTGDPNAGTHDLTVQTQEEVAVGTWVAFRGTLRRDVDLGFGYHYDALVEGGTRVD